MIPDSRFQIADSRFMIDHFPKGMPLTLIYEENSHFKTRISVFFVHYSRSSVSWRTTAL